MKNYGSAEKYFSLLKSLAVQQENKLEAMRGLLRCQFTAQNWKEALPNAQELLLQNGMAGDDKMMAGLVIARNKQLNGDDEAAIAAYKQVINAGKSAFAAEAQYHIAEILLQQQKLPEAEKAGFEVIRKSGAYEYWVTKSYILLGDVYTQQKDWFNAEATFKSIIENAIFPELKTVAQEKLQQVIAEKNKANKIDQQ
jgi:tetratricopeptide (TPR) repeat protein